MYNIDDKYGIPKDVIKKELLFQMIGQNEVVLENYKCIKKITDEEIIIICHKYTLKITGNKLDIKYYNNESMMIGGVIYEVSFL